MKQLILAIVLALVSASVNANDKLLSIYLEVMNVTNRQVDCFDEWVLSSQRDNLTEFWWAYAKRECALVINAASELAEKQTGAIGAEKAIDEFESELNKCVETVVFDMWDEINLSIVDSPRTCAMTATKGNADKATRLLLEVVAEHEAARSMKKEIE